MSEKELSQYYWLKMEIKSLEEKIDEFGYGVGAIKVKDNVGQSNPALSSIQEKRALLLDQLIEARLSALENYLKIESYIESVKEAEIRQIMRFRFLDLKNWNEIAEELHYDRTTVAKKVRAYISHNSH